MDISLKISATTAPLIRKAYHERLSEVEAAVKAKKVELIELENQLEEIKKGLQGLDDAINGRVVEDYNPKTGVLDKIKYVLRYSDTPLTSREISERIMALDSELAKIKMTTIKNVSTLLSIYKEKSKGELFKRIETEGEDNTFIINKPK